MRNGGGKQKGASFEREVCVKLSKWVTSGEREDVYWRSAMSGGRATVGHKSGKSHASQVGDISCIHPSGHKFSEYYAIECKHYASLDFQGLITGKGKLLSFWDEIGKQAERYGKHPFMVAKQNRFPEVVCLTHSGMITLGLSDPKTILISRPFDLYIFKLDRFLEMCQPYV